MGHEPFQLDVGRLTTEGTWSGSWITTAQFNYDPMGRVIGRWNCWGSSGSCSNEVSTSYDRAGDVTSETNPAGVQISYAYNDAPRVSSVTSSFVDANHPATLWTKDSSEGYYPTGALRKAAFANGLTEANLYESRVQPCRMDLDSSGTLLTTCDDTLPSGNVQHLHYIFGGWGSTNNGDVTNLIAVGAQNFNRSYAYDSLNRISSMSAPGDQCSGLSWTIDPWGNRTDQTATGGTCNTFHQSAGTNNRFGSPYQYDAAGNMTYDGNHNYTYDAEDRTIAVDGGSTASYVYNAEGERAQRTVSGVSTQYHYDSLGRVVAEYDGGCGPTCWNAGYVYINGQMKAEYKNSTTYFVHSDLLGSTRLLTGYPTPSIIDCDDYYPFGELTPCGGTNTLTHKFTGKERDYETGGTNGLDYFGARYNSSSLGRFMSPDPDSDSGFENQDDPQSWNAYSYVRNNPLTLTDSDGRDYRVCVLEGNCTQSCVTYANLTDFQNALKGTGATLQNGQISVNVNGQNQVVGTYQFFVGPGVEGPGVQYDNILPNVFLGIAGGIKGGVEGIAENVLGSAGRETAEGTAAGIAQSAGTEAITQSVQISGHAVIEAAKDGVTKDAIKKVIQLGERFYDPTNNSVVYVVKGGMASGKSVAVATDAVTGVVKTVFTSSKSVIRARFIPIN